MIKHFINLTNGIEKISELKDHDLNFCYIASTTIERKDYIKLIRDLDHNLLFNLAIGNTCILYDYGTNRPFSKTCYHGVQIIVYILTRYWLGKDYERLAYRLDRRGKKVFKEIDYYNKIYEDLFLYNNTKEKNQVKNKLSKYKKFLLTDEIKLLPCSSSTKHDGDYTFYKNLIKLYISSNEILQIN